MKPRRLLPLFALLAAATATAEPAGAQDLSGTWTLTSEGRGGAPITQTLVLDQAGSTLTGTIQFTGGGRRGGGGGRGGRGTQPLPISDGTVEGSAFRFALTIDFQGSSFAQRYAGTISGDTLEGVIEGEVGSRPVRGTRGG
jgi:hypothetical protein